ncbi:MAG: Twin-arginine translocation protein TatB [Labilithrix sp.]|nr:Twin-arginine translocation protein TatB [Labilithrix sp.]
MVPSVPVFGFSLSELIVVIVVALVVIGPKDLPKMLRKLGQYAGKLRRMAADLRAQSGIDEALRTEGLADDIAEIRKLARGELDNVQRSITSATAAAAIAGPVGQGATNAQPAYRDGFFVVRDREYPRDGADAYGALPDNAIVYADGLPKAPLARDPLYVLGDPDGIVPEPPPAPSFVDEHGDHDEHGVPTEAQPAEDQPAEAVAPHVTEPAEETAQTEPT